MTIQNKKSYQRNSRRLSNFILELSKKLDKQEYTQILNNLDSNEISLINKLESLSWVPVDLELKIIKIFCKNRGDYRIFHNASKIGMIKYLEQTLPHNTFYSNYKDVFCALPSFIFFWMNLKLCRLYYEDEYFFLELSFEQEEVIETIFVSALIQGLIEYLKIPQAGLYISSMTISQDDNVLELMKLNPLLKYDSHLVQMKLFIPDDILNKSLEKNDPIPTEISLSNHKESQKQLFVKQVLARSSKIFQDKRELTTAVEYLNFANDELEKKIEESKQELNIAKNIQNGLIPQRIPDWNGLRFFTYSKALTTVSGDFYDYFELKNGNLGIVIADVCGHGVPAALISAVAKIAFTNHCQLMPKNVLSNVNLDLIRHVKMEGYLTAVYLRIDKNLKLHYSLGGIPAPILLRQKTGETEILKGSGVLCGMFPNAGELFESHSLQLESGDKLILFTDGITEALNKEQKQLGLITFQKYIKETAGMDAEETGNYILKKYHEYIIGEQISDDTTLIVFEISPHLEYYLKYCQNAKKYFINNELDKAVEELRNALHIFPGRPEILYSLGKVLLKLNRTIEAKEIADQLLSLIPNHSGAIVIKALYSIKNSKWALAESQLLQALALKSSNKQALYHLIKVLFKENKIEDAQRYFQDFQTIHSGSKSSIRKLENLLK